MEGEAMKILAAVLLMGGVGMGQTLPCKKVPHGTEMPKNGACTWQEWTVKAEQGEAVPDVEVRRKPTCPEGWTATVTGQLLSQPPQDKWECVRTDDHVRTLPYVTPVPQMPKPQTTSPEACCGYTLKGVYPEDVKDPIFLLEQRIAKLEAEVAQLKLAAKPRAVQKKTSKPAQPRP
jgi:hypothetical protein